MYVRLAFSVAAHLEPEVLLVDEVLAVGDLAFQKKCLGKMDEVTQEGRTILFVSHDMGAIQRLAEYSLLLDEGKLIARGETKNIVDQYLTQTAVMLRNSGTLGEFHREKDTLGVSARLSGYRILDATGKPKAVFGFGEPFWVEIECAVQEFVSEVSFLLGIDTLYGQRIATVTSLEAGRVFSSGQGTVVVGRVQVENLLLKPGMYSLTLGLFAPKAGIDRVGNAAQIEVTNASEKHRHIEQVTVGYLQIPSPNWEIYVSKTARLP